METIVTIPAFNEERTIKKVIKQIKKVMKGDNYAIQVINDGSTDKTREKALEENIIVYSHSKNKGLASTFRTAMKMCVAQKPNIIVQTDGDSQYPISDIPKLIATLKETKADLVLGQRKHIESMPLIKKIGNKAFSTLTSFICKQKIQDSQTGFRVFNTKVAKLPIKSKFTYTQPQIIEACRAGLKVVEVPCKFYSRKKTGSRLMRSPLHYAKEALSDIFRIYYPNIYKFYKYSLARVMTATLGCVVLYVFADKLGFPAWLTNMLWIPISFFISFVLIQRFWRKIN